MSKELDEISARVKAEKDEQAQKAFIDCNHIGFHNPAAANTMLIGNDLMSIATHNCSHCGHVFTKITELANGDKPKEAKSDIFVPNARPLK